ncbi:MAG: translation initiation factor IF-2 N-terminal domain-containing protein [Bacillus subtilis]|nr:translation initiation factor IF-2 N-terminal domain-containing protein [Bacillus subtilis]
MEDLQKTRLNFKKHPEEGKFLGRKKKKYKEKEAILSKEEKLEQAKLIQDKFKKKKKEEKLEPKEAITSIAIDKPLTVGELAGKLEIGVSDVIKQLMMSGVLATVNQNIDVETAKGVTEKLGFTVLTEEEKPKEEVQEKKEIDESKLKFRATCCYNNGTR